jgi:hypothetical protein
MKKLQEIINQKPVYLNYWNEYLDVISDFEGICINAKSYNADKYDDIDYCSLLDEKSWLEEKQKMKDALKKYNYVNILFASYDRDCCYGEAFVLFQNKLDEKLYEVNGHHCSCNGLEYDWSPDEIHLKELENRLLNGKFGNDENGYNFFKKELCEFLGIEFIGDINK